MSLRRGGVRALRALYTHTCSNGAALELARPLQQLPLQHLLHKPGSSGWGHQWPLPGPPSTFYHLRHAQTTSDRPAEEQPKVLPDAEECDTAIQNYAKIRLSYKDNLRVPTTYKTAWQRVVDVVEGTWKVTLMVVKFTLSIPGRIWALRLKSRADWAATWANVKKTVKDEAHHYWVS
jgi:hypothetical protein